MILNRWSVRAFCTAALCAVWLPLSVAATETARVTAPSGVRIRAGASAKSQPLVRAENGAVLEVLDKNGAEETIEGRKARWWKVRYQGKDGWCFSGFLQKEIDQKQLPSSVMSEDELYALLNEYRDAYNAATERNDRTAQENVLNQMLKDERVSKHETTAELIAQHADSFWRQEYSPQALPWAELLVSRFGQTVGDHMNGLTHAELWRHRIEFLKSGAKKPWLNADLNSLAAKVLEAVKQKDRSAMLLLLRPLEPQYGWWRSESENTQPEKIVEFLLKHHSGKVEIAPGQAMPLSAKPDDRSVMLNTHGWLPMPDGYTNVQLWFNQTTNGLWEWGGIVLGEDDPVK